MEKEKIYEKALEKLGGADMIIKLIKRLCKLQGIKIHMKIPVICPRCFNKTLEIDVETGQGVCYSCQKESNIKELVTVYEKEELDQHRKFKNLSEHNKGVGGNY